MNGVQIEPRIRLALGTTHPWVYLRELWRGHMLFTMARHTGVALSLQADPAVCRLTP